MITPIGWPLERIYAFRGNEDLSLVFRPPARVMPIEDEWGRSVWRVTKGGLTVTNPKLDEALKSFKNDAPCRTEPHVDGPDGVGTGQSDITALASRLAFAGRLGLEKADAIARDGYARGWTVERVLDVIHRRELACYPNLHPVMPPRADWPTPNLHKVFVRANEWMDRRYATSVGPWTMGPWWSLRRTARVAGERREAARVYLNGNGLDHELRFTVHSPRRDEEPIGAANHFCRVTPDLFKDLDQNGKGRLGARGLWAPKPADVLLVMRWCDARVEELWV